MRIMACFLVLFSVVFISGCQSELGVVSTSKEEWLASRVHSPLTGKGMSYKVKNFLVEEAMLSEYEESPERALRDLHQRFAATKDRNTLLALVELCYIQAQRESGLQRLSHFLSSAAYSASFFDTAVIPDPTPFVPDFLYFCRCYNYATAEILRIMQEQGLSFQRSHDILILQGTIRIEPSKSFLPYPLETYKEFILCNEYIPYGFLTSSRSFGMGVPLIAIQEGAASLLDEKLKGSGIHMIPDAPGPATAFIRIKNTSPNQYEGTMEFYDPYKQSSFDFNGTEVPLEVDMTTVFAYMTKRGAAYSGFSALANPENMHVPEGLFLMTPFDENKIPLVIVHGLMSQPRTWSQLINTLMNNDQIRGRYQVWLFAYPTGYPVLLSAAKLRRTLSNAQSIFDPSGSNPNFNQMVMIGHSMGGLLTRSMVQDSADNLVNMLFDVPIDEMEITDDEKNLLKISLLFKPLPFVSRVVFMATPHRGSEMTHWTLMKFATKFISFPREFAGKIAHIGKKVILKESIVNAMDKSFDDIQGVDGLDPNNSIMQFMADQAIFAKYHSIIGDESKAGQIGGTDGIVPYQSAHLDGAESELVILSGHNVQDHPAAIREVRRILLEHMSQGGKK